MYNNIKVIKMKPKTKLIAFRVDEKIYDELVKITIKESKNEGKIIGMSKIIRKLIENGIK